MKLSKFILIDFIGKLPFFDYLVDLHYLIKVLCDVSIRHYQAAHSIFQTHA